MSDSEVSDVRRGEALADTRAMLDAMEEAMGPWGPYGWSEAASLDVAIAGIQAVVERRLQR